MEEEEDITWNKISRGLLWFLVFVSGCAVGFNLLAESDMLRNVIGAVILFITALVSIKTNCFIGRG